MHECVRADQCIIINNILTHPTSPHITPHTQGREVASKLVKERTDTVADVEGKEWHPAQFKGGVCGEHGGVSLSLLSLHIYLL